MSTDAISGSTSANTTTSTSTMSAVEKGSLDKSAFLKLLVTQLQNQDPMKPMEDKEYIAQLAQFSSLEQMQNLNQTMQSFITLQNNYNQSQSGISTLSLIGRNVTWVDQETSQSYKGVVKSVQFDSSGTPSLVVPVKDKDKETYTDMTVPINYVHTVSDKTTSNSAT